MSTSPDCAWIARAMPCPCCAPKIRVRRMSRSSVPWRCAEYSRSARFRIDMWREYADAQVECQPEDPYGRACAAAPPRQHCGDAGPDLVSLLPVGAHPCPPARPRAARVRVRGVRADVAGGAAEASGEDRAVP